MELLSWCPIFKFSHCNSSGDQVHIDFIYWYLIFKWVTVTWKGWEGARKVVPAMATRRHVLLWLSQLFWFGQMPLPLQFIISLALLTLAPGRSGCNLKKIIFNLFFIHWYCIFRYSYHNALEWMPWDLTDDKSILVQVMAWCHQASSHYLDQCWPSSVPIWRH